METVNGDNPPPQAPKEPILPARSWRSWFEASVVAAGTIETVNPWNGANITCGPRRQGDEDRFVFWTRHSFPVLSTLFQPLDRLGETLKPFTVQFTGGGGAGAHLVRAVMNEPKATIDDKILSQRTMAHMDFAPSVRGYDLDPIELAHAETPGISKPCSRLLAEAPLYRFDRCPGPEFHGHSTVMMRRNLDRAAHATWFSDLPRTTRSPADTKALLAALAPIARAACMRPTLCAQPELLVDGVAPAACIDTARLFGDGRRVATSRNRPGCFCAASRDIGRYETCPHGCRYCYAVNNERNARANHAAHVPEAARIV